MQEAELTDIKYSVASAQVIKVQKLSCACLVLGTGILMYNRPRKGVMRAIGTFGGSALVLQGLRFRAKANNLMRENGISSLTIEEAITINARKDEVYTVCSKIADSDLFPGVKNVQRIMLQDNGGPPLGVDNLALDRKSANEVIDKIVWQFPNCRAHLILIDAGHHYEGTEARLICEYTSLMDYLSEWILSIGACPKRMIKQSLRKLKQLTEAGEIATTEGQPHGHNGKLSQICDMSQLIQEEVTSKIGNMVKSKISNLVERVL